MNQAIKINYDGDMSGNAKDGSMNVFTIAKKDPIYKVFNDVDFEALLINPKLMDIVLKDYYTYASASDDGEIRISFSAKYDLSSICLNWSHYDDEPVSIEFIWYINGINVYGDYEEIRKKVQNEVIPELITKILSIA